MEATVTTGTNTVASQYPKVTPPSHRVHMNIEKLGHLAYRQHRVRFMLACHTSSLYKLISTPTSGYKTLLNPFHCLTGLQSPQATMGQVL
jgi:hypothetical protein